MKQSLLIYFVFLSNCSESQRLLIRYDKLEEYYQNHRHETLLSASSEMKPQNDLNQAIRDYKFNLCHTVADSLFYKRRCVAYFELRNRDHIQHLRKYYKKFTRTYSFMFNVLEVYCYPQFNRYELKKVSLDWYPYSTLNVKLGKNTVKEKVFSCLIDNRRSNRLEQIFISRPYQKKRFVFTRSMNQKLKLLALVEDEAEDVLNEPISSYKSRCEWLRAEKRGCDLDNDDKVRLCNLAVNTHGLRSGKYLFWPQKFNLHPTCRNTTTSDILLLMRRFENSNKVRAFGCQVLDLKSNKHKTVYVSSGMCRKNSMSAYVYLEYSEKLYYFRYITKTGIGQCTDEDKTVDELSVMSEYSLPIENYR